MATWEDPEYTLTMSTVGDVDVIPPAPYNVFKLERKVASGTTFYKVKQVTPGGDNPFSGVVLLPQAGQPLIHYLPPDERLTVPDPVNDDYRAALELLIDRITGTDIAQGPDSFERLVGYLIIDGENISPVTLYKVENTHKNGELLLIALLRISGESPGGSIGVIGR
jgi:hypothetical protein